MNSKSIRCVLVLKVALWLIGPTAGAAAPEDPAAVPAGDGRLLFASGFESDFRVNPWRHSNGHWFPRPVGVDHSTGFRWPDDSLPSSGGRFYLSVVADDVDNYATVSADSTEGPYGATTRALRMWIREDDPDTKSGTRISYGHRSDDGALEQLYSRYWLRFPANLHDMMNQKGDWWLITEWRGRHDDHRLRVTMENRGEGVGLVWICDTQELALAGGKERWSIVWRRESSVRPIAGRWFLYEIYYRRHRTNGRVWVAMDGKVVCDVTGRTMTDARLGGISLMKCYPGRRLFYGPRTAEQWIDDFEMWTDFPPRPRPIPSRGLPTTVGLRRP